MTARSGAKAGWALAAALAVAAPGAAVASEADAFENKVAPISGQLYPKAGRLELTPTVNLSLSDAFYSKIFFGAKLDYHLAESFSLGASFAAGPASPTPSASICAADPLSPGVRTCREASPAQLYQVPGKIRAIAGGQVAWAPVYGKLSVLAELPVHFDLSLMGGADWVSYQEVLSGTQALAGAAPGTKSTIGGHLGLGMRLFFAGFMALRLEVKDTIYSAAIGNLGGNRLQNQLFMEMGLSLFFPTSRGANP
jgi:outer membrane beta-barrel protein